MVYRWPMIVSASAWSTGRPSMSRTRQGWSLRQKVAMRVSNVVAMETAGSPRTFRAKGTGGTQPVPRVADRTEEVFACSLRSAVMLRPPIRTA